jgi:tetratricopeptide (TPR) repeat protein
MRAFVFTDPALSKRAGQFVWLSIDTEKRSNAPFLKKYPINAWPSFYVIDAGAQVVVLRWVGGASVAQLERLFEDGQSEFRRKPDELLARADALYGKGKYAESIPAYRAALRHTPPGWEPYSRVVESLLFSLQVEGKNSECVALARQTWPRLSHTASAADLAGSGLDCALGLPAGSPGRAEAVAAFEADARFVLSDPDRQLAADDRSALYGSIHDARKEAGDEAGAREVARQWVADLEARAASAATPEQRTALDPNLLSAYAAAGEYEKAIPMLEQSEREFPRDYNPPARLAYVYLHLKKYGRALAASDRALARVDGPRRLQVLAIRAEIDKGRGDILAARRTLEEAVSYAENLPPGQRSEGMIAYLKKKRDTLARP